MSGRLEDRKHFCRREREVWNLLDRYAQWRSKWKGDWLIEGVVRPWASFRKYKGLEERFEAKNIQVNGTEEGNEPTDRQEQSRKTMMSYTIRLFLQGLRPLVHGIPRTRGALASKMLSDTLRYTRSPDECGQSNNCCAGCLFSLLITQLPPALTVLIEGLRLWDWHMTNVGHARKRNVTISI